MKHDFPNRIINRMRLLIQNCKCICSTWILYLHFHLIGIDIGSKCRFYGLAHINKGNGGYIKIGSNCIFRSSTTSNNIGINHPCMISCTPISKHGITYKAKLIIGNGSGFSGSTIWCFHSITIGNNVRIGANTLIIDGDAHFDDIRTPSPQPIVIEDNVWLGANVVVMKGVRIGENTVIGMNSVVTKSIPANCIAAGNPCKVIRPINSN